MCLLFQNQTAVPPGPQGICSTPPVQAQKDTEHPTLDMLFFLTYNTHDKFNL